MWVINEEKQQFNSDSEYRHDLAEELLIFAKLRKLYMKKFEYSAKLIKQRLETVTFERDFLEFTKDSEVLTRLQDKILGNPEIVPKV